MLERYTYPPEVKAEFYDDSWYFHQQWAKERRHWREYHEGHGYWRNDVWVEFGVHP